MQYLLCTCMCGIGSRFLFISVTASLQASVKVGGYLLDARRYDICDLVKNSLKTTTLKPVWKSKT